MLGGIVPLPLTVAHVLLIVILCRLVEVGLRLEIAHSEGDASVFKSLTKNGNKTVHINGIIECKAELLYRGGSTLFLKSLPLLRLCGLYKVYECFNV